MSLTRKLTRLSGARVDERGRHINTLRHSERIGQIDILGGCLALLVIPDPKGYIKLPKVEIEPQGRVFEGWSLFRINTWIHPFGTL